MQPSSNSYKHQPVRNQMVQPSVEWCCEMDNQATTPFDCCSSTAFLPVRQHCANATQNRCQDLNSFFLRELEDAFVLHGWRLYQQDLKSNNLSLIKATHVAQNRPVWWLMSMFGAMWRYALLVVLARNDNHESTSDDGVMPSRALSWSSRE